MRKINIEIDIQNNFSFAVGEAPNLRRILAPPNNVGVYVLKKGEDVLYVGMSTVLSSRISDHLRGSTETSETFYEEIDSFDVYITENNSYEDVEDHAVKLWREKVDLSEVPTYALSEELARREGVREYRISPEQRAVIHFSENDPRIDVDGPAVLLVNID